MAFYAYLEHFHLSFVAVAMEARVRLFTVWNIDHNIPVSDSHALQVRAALQRLTGRAYTGRIALLPLEFEKP